MNSESFPWKKKKNTRKEKHRKTEQAMSFLLLSGPLHVMVLKNTAWSWITGLASQSKWILPGTKYYPCLCNWCNHFLLWFPTLQGAASHFATQESCCLFHSPGVKKESKPNQTTQSVQASLVWNWNCPKDLSHEKTGIKKGEWNFPGGTVVKNPPANAGDMGLSPAPGRSHMPRSN